MSELSLGAGPRRVGFYWTLPVNWAGFRQISPDIETAAGQSRTIRYQRDLIRRWAIENRIVLDKEIAFIDVQPDRATCACREIIAALKHEYRVQPVQLVHVQFEDGRWRSNYFLKRFCEHFEFDLIGIYPDPIIMGGRWFDPFEHFRSWRRIDDRQKTQLRLKAHKALDAVLAIPVGQRETCGQIADRLNADNVLTVTGRPWTAHSVKKSLQRREKLSEAPARGAL